MLTKNQEKYLQKIPVATIVQVRPWDPKAVAIANRLIDEIHSVIHGATVLFMGAAALGIAGQNDIDLYILHGENPNAFIRKIVKIFGPPMPDISIVKWQFQRDGFDVELYISDPATESMREQIRIFEILRDDKQLRQRYEILKKASDGFALREYMRRKYEFFNELLNLDKFG